LDQESDDPCALSQNSADIPPGGRKQMRSEPIVSKSQRRRTIKRARLGELDAILGFHLRLAHGAVFRHFSESFADLGLTQKQVSALWLIKQNPGIAQANLCDALQIDRATAMAIVNKLQAKGLTQRVRSSLDQRMKVLELTSKGEAQLKAAKNAIRKHEKWLKGRFSKEETASLVELLKRIHE
jgi:DNA-binding MarR family transcriptional regulator